MNRRMFMSSEKTTWRSFGSTRSAWEGAADFHPPTQEATAVKPWRNASRVSSEALAKEDMLRRVPPKSTKGPRL
jgi:hypothetical protein